MRSGFAMTEVVHRFSNCVNALALPKTRFCVTIFTLMRTLYDILLLPLKWVLRAGIALRYRVRVVGLNALQLDPSRGTLFLPNHPAQMDPVIVELLLFTRFHPRPLVDEAFFYQKGARPFMRIVRALPLASMGETANRWRAKQVEKQFGEIVEGLKRGENYLIYPAGRLKLSGVELIGGSSFAYRLVQACPECNVVLVRTEGMWGSQFSRALTGATPNFGAMLWRGLKILFSNVLLFTPRRKVTVTFATPPPDFPKQGTRMEFNRYLEQWYNRYPEPGPEPLSLVPYVRWKKSTPTPFAPASKEERGKEVHEVPGGVKKRMLEYLSGLSGKPMLDIQPSDHLSEDLGLDSLDALQIAMFIEEEFPEAGPIAQVLTTVEDVLQAASGGLKHESAPEEEIKGVKVERRRLSPEPPVGRTIQESFVRVCKKRGTEIACIDRMSGSMRYKRLLRAALALREEISTYPQDKIGVLLPASSAAYLVIFAILLANKVPVMLNWTVGSRALDHAVDLTGIRAVISSSRFLDRLDAVHLGKAEDLLIYIEDVRRHLRLRDRLRALAKSVLPTQWLLARLGLRVLTSSDIAVILFTSGTETLPKGVPLSHANLLSNQRATWMSAHFRDDEVLYGILPPFHSFGFSMTGLFPFLTGMKACFSPDPTASHTLAKEIAQWHPTLLACAPSFIKALFRAARHDELASLRLIVSGAEKTPQALFDFVEEHLPQAELLEGYGITECSPVVTLQRQGKPHVGVGPPLPGVQLLIIDPETEKPLPEEREGEICIAGSGVFSGYLGVPRDPFIEIEGKCFYRSGDRGYLTKDHELVLTGRLKRFVKIGGEMVSLGGLEEELDQLAREQKWAADAGEGPILAVSAREKESKKPQIILYTTFAITKDAVNNALQVRGYSRLIKVSEVKQITSIPLTGTGKTHYRLLDEQ